MTHPPVSQFRSPNEQAEVAELGRYVQSKQFSAHLDWLRQVARNGKVEELPDNQYRMLRKLRSLMLEASAQKGGNSAAGAR